MPTDFIKFNTDGKISLVTPARWFKSRTPNRASELALKNPPSGPVPWLATHRDGRTCTVVAPRWFIACDIAAIELRCTKEALEVILVSEIMKASTP